MKSNNRQLIILAAGRGTRMNGGDLPKVLVHLAGRPMIDCVLESIARLNLPEKPIIVIGFQKEKVQEIVGDRAEYVVQEEQLGTGHAVSLAKDKLSKFEGNITILYGDHPLVTSETVKKLFNSKESCDTVLTMGVITVPDFSGINEIFYHYGRIIRDLSGQIIAIRELKDCSEQEKEIKEVNPGYYCFNSEWLWQNIDKLKNNNNQKEYYLTDLISLAFSQKEKINSLDLDPIECLGVNTKEQLQIVEEIINSK